VDGIDCIDDLAARGVFAEIAMGSRLDRLTNLFVGLKTGQDDYVRRTRALLQCQQGFDPTHCRHVKIQQQHVDCAAFKEDQGLLATLHRANDLQTGLGAKNAAESCTHNRVVVYDEKSNRRSLRQVLHPGMLLTGCHARRHLGNETMRG
jgi:hypothetical protein